VYQSIIFPAILTTTITAQVFPLERRGVRGQDDTINIQTLQTGFNTALIVVNFGSFTKKNKKKLKQMAKNANNKTIYLPH